MFSRMAEIFRPLLGAFFALLLALGPGAHAFEQPEGASGLAPKPLVKARKQIVVTAHPLAAEAALAILRKGGSAVDAGIAAQMVLNLVEPQSSGIGGGGFILTWDARAKRIASYDGRETAPSAATPQLFLDAAGNELSKAQGDRERAFGGRAGRSRGAEARPCPARQACLGRFVRAGDRARPRGLRRLAAPRQDVVGARTRNLHAGSTRAFLRRRRAPLAFGYKLKNPALAETFATIAREGPDAFYRGEIARDIAAAVQSDPRIPGSLSAEDLASYHAMEREPVCVLYRAHRVCGAGPPSSGAVAVGQVLGLIAPFDLGAAPARRGSRASHRGGRAPRACRPRALSG